MSTVIYQLHLRSGGRTLKRIPIRKGYILQIGDHRGRVVVSCASWTLDVGGLIVGRPSVDVRLGR